MLHIIFQLQVEGEEKGKEKGQISLQRQASQETQEGEASSEQNEMTADFYVFYLKGHARGEDQHQDPGQVKANTRAKMTTTVRN